MLTSTGAKVTLSPISFATSFPFDVGKSHKTTRLPSLTNLSTVALPKPDAPPVTKLTEPF